MGHLQEGAGAGWTGQLSQHPAHLQVARSNERGNSKQEKPVSSQAPTGTLSLPVIELKPRVLPRVQQMAPQAQGTALGPTPGSLLPWAEAADDHSRALGPRALCLTQSWHFAASERAAWEPPPH